MSVQVEKLENNTIKLTVEVSAEELEKALQDVYNRQKKSISLPGFRKGKVPRAMVEKMYGAAVFYEDAANQLIPTAYYEAVQECGEEIVSNPTIDITQIEKGKPFIFTAEVAVKPDFELGTYKGVEVTKIDTAVPEEEITVAVDRDREKNAREVVVTDRPIESGDVAVIDFEGFVDGASFEGGKGENYGLEIGSNSFIPGFEDQLIGKNIEEELEVNVTFPEDYHAEDLKGKDATFKVKIHEVKTKELPEADDDFAQDVSEFDTFEEYKNSIRERLEKQRTEAAKRTQEDEAIKKIAADSHIELPEAMISTRCDEMINQFGQQLAQQGLSMEQYMQFSGTTIDQLREQVRPETVERIEGQLVLDKIAEVEKIEITDADIEEELKKMAELYNMDMEDLNKRMGESDRENMRKDLAAQRAVDVIYDNVVFVDAPAEEEKTEEADA